jgi:MoaA/NifB/PqqE/SkfB family radical SAM enzyme
MDNKLEVNLINFLCKNYNADIHLEGGEIFLEEGLITALSGLDKAIRQHLTITTNGTIRSANSDVIQVLQSLGCLRFSVEGHTDSLNQAVRKHALLPVLENALYYQDQGIPVTLRITLNKLNIDMMFNEIVPSLEEKGFSRFQIYEMQSIGRGKTSDLCINGNLDRFWGQLVKCPPNSHFKISLPLHRKTEAFEYITQFKQIGIEVMEVGNIASVNIGTNGSVRICPWDTTSEPLAFIQPDNFESLFSIIETQDIPHKCEYCSHIVLKGVQGVKAYGSI